MNRLNKTQKIQLVLWGAGAGVLSGFFGAGGGIPVVCILGKLGLPTKQAHASAILAVLPMTVVSGAVYLLQGQVAGNAALWQVLGGGAAGGLLGALLLGKLSDAWVQWLFTLLMAISGLRMLF